MDPFVSIGLPTRNNTEDLLECLKAIEELEYDPGRLEAIIWDNNPSEEKRLKVKEVASDLQKNKSMAVKFIESKTNFGVYSSRDALFRRANPESEYLLSIDDDVLLPADLLRQLIPKFQKGPSIGVIGPRTVFADAPGRTAHGAGFINWWLGRYSDVEATQTLECDYVIGCCMLMRRTVFDQIGGFDLDYFTSHGEVDFCIKAVRRGYRVLYCPDPVVKHKVKPGGTRSSERLYYVYRNKLLVIRKNAPRLQKCVSLVLYGLFWAPKSILESIARNRGIHPREIRILLEAMRDGWLNRAGKRF